MKQRKSLARGKGLLLLALVSPVGAAFTCALQAFAATTNVNIVNFAFSPPAVSLQVNDSVRWVWVGSNHSATSTSNPKVWDSGVHNAGFTFTNTFGSAGTFPYFCTVHPFMTGSVNIQALISPPSVAITNPADGAVFSAPASFTLAATASSSSGSVTNVQFFQGATALGNATASPYAVAVNNLAAGDYTFSAVASDNAGLKATNAISLSVVTPAAIVLGNAQRLSPEEFRFT